MRTDAGHGGRSRAQLQVRAGASSLVPLPHKLPRAGRARRRASPSADGVGQSDRDTAIGAQMSRAVHHESELAELLR